MEPSFLPQEQLASLQDHHRQQTSALLLKHKKELEEARAEAPVSANGHDSNGFVSTEDLQTRVQEALLQAQDAEKALKRAQEKEKVSDLVCGGCFAVPIWYPARERDCVVEPVRCTLPTIMIVSSMCNEAFSIFLKSTRRIVLI